MSMVYFSHFSGYFDREKHRLHGAEYIGDSTASADKFLKFERKSRLLYRRLLKQLEVFYASEAALPSFSYSQVEVGLGHIILRVCRKLTSMRNLRDLISERAISGLELHYSDISLHLPAITAHSLANLKSEHFDTYLLVQMLSGKILTWESLPEKSSLGSASAISKIYRPYRSVVNAIGRNRIAVKGTYLSRMEEATLEMSFGQIPRLRFLESETITSTRECAAEDHALRSRLSNHLKEAFRKNDENFSTIASAVSVSVPYLYLGGSKQLANLGSKYFPKSPEIFFTANSYMTDDIYKSGLLLRPNDSVHAVIQHGNLVGTHRHFENTVEEKTAEKYLTWGWSGVRNGRRVIPIGVHKNVSRWTKPPQGKHLLLILRGASPNWWSWDTGGEHYFYLDFISKFLDKLDPFLKQRLLVRTYFDKGTLSKTDREILANKSDGYLSFSDYSASLGELLEKSQLVIHGYDSTGILECAVANRPFIALLPSSPGLLSADLQELYKTLQKAKIFFADVELAASHLLSISQDVSFWWNSEDVRSALEDLREQIAHPIEGSRLKTLREALAE